MFGCYPKGDANDPEVYVAAVAAVLSEYPESVIDTATDPRTGLPRRLKFLPRIAEVSDFCEAEMATVRAIQAKRAQVEKQIAERISNERPTVGREAISRGFEQLSATLKLETKSDEAAA